MTRFRASTFSRRTNHFLKAMVPEIRRPGLWATQSFQLALPVAVSGAVTSFQSTAPSALVRMTQWSFQCSTS